MAINRSTPENFVYDNTSKINKNFVYKNLKRSKCYASFILLYISFGSLIKLVSLTNLTG